jgi:glyoxylase-like metal-dependent hydrolase (beta-lactamase superfamily II)
VRFDGEARVKKILFLVMLGFAACAAARAPAPAPYHLIPGQFGPNSSPDGNSVLLDAPEGLILVDTGRHAEHTQRLIDYAHARGRPIVAVFNTHWHLDHSSGNGLVRAAFPHAEIYASNAVDGALATFLRESREDAERRLAAGQLPAAQQDEVRHFLATMDHAEALRPTRPVTRSGMQRIGGRPLRVNLAPFAATEGDVWLYDPAARLLVAGDLVVTEVPFMDTACAEGWRRALDLIAATPFRVLIPGHGDPMTHAQFLAWRTAFDNLLDCGASDRPRAICVAGWRRDAAIFMRPGRERLVDGMVGYYLDSRLRAAPEERQHYCRPLRAAA